MCLALTAAILQWFENTKASQILEQSKQSIRSLKEGENLNLKHCKNEKLGVMRREKDSTLMWINTLDKSQQNEVRRRTTTNWQQFYPLKIKRTMLRHLIVPKKFSPKKSPS